ncbi:MAG: hypothetical protein CMJ18_24230 [Phycisphaeraceae bacterium]|nr:hypothetical protein [Phycisphaeraceae bacterium]
MPDALQGQPAALHRDRPQCWTSSRLLKAGESIEFSFQVPDGCAHGRLQIFPRYLEQAEPSDRFVPGGDPVWVDDLPSETIDPAFSEGRASVIYEPRALGGHLARWHVGEEVLYRYFSVVEDDWIVLRLSTFGPLESDPSLHGTGVPIDQRLAAAQFEPDLPIYRRMLEGARRFGDGLVPCLPDDPPTFTSSDEQRDALYGLLLDKARSVMPFGDDIRAARIDMHHDLDPGYTRSLARLGIHDHCGLNEANAKPWLGMPEFPYFSSPIDCRKPNQANGGDVVAHQWDFCGGFHFLGPVSWHYKASEGDWPVTEACLRAGLEEFANAAAMSGHPAFVHLLYDGVLESDYPNPAFRCVLGADDHGMPRFVEQYQRFMAFEAPRLHKVAFARSVDVADFYRRHYRVTPRTVFVSRTDHVEHDKWWLCHWQNDGVLVPRQVIPWGTRISTILDRRDSERTFKDPLSYEYIQVEDQKRSARFERACANPVWWFDYTRQASGPRGSTIAHTRTPDVEIRRSGWRQTADGWTLELDLKTEASFRDYAIAVWDLPDGFAGDPRHVSTDARESIVVWNDAGEYHLVLIFDLEPNLRIRVALSAE